MLALLACARPPPGDGDHMGSVRSGHVATLADALAVARRAAGAKRLGLAAVVAACVALATPSPSDATVNLTAVKIRIGDHPAFARVVVDFADGELLSRTEMIAATDPEPFRDGIARLRFVRRQVRAEAPPASGHGVRVR